MIQSALKHGIFCCVAFPSCVGLLKITASASLPKQQGFSEALLAGLHLALVLCWGKRQHPVHLP